MIWEGGVITYDRGEWVPKWSTHFALSSQRALVKKGLVIILSNLTKYDALGHLLFL
jgi:hypothetical protein